MAFLQESVLSLNENMKGHYQDCVSNSGINVTNGDNVFEQHKLFNMNLKTVVSRTEIISKLKNPFPTFFSLVQTIFGF